MKENVRKEMMEYYKGDPRRIQHFIKVHAFAQMIGSGEHLDLDTQEILEIAAYVHDIGIKISEEKYGSCNGKLQEQEGPALTRDLLEKVGASESIIARVCYLVGHHHTYTNIDGLDYQILVEADFLVNLYEDNTSPEGIESAYQKIFKTNTGRELCELLYLKPLDSFTPLN
ncbi:MAG: HD domain-containing protein [Eubacteriales bacterium]